MKKNSNQRKKKYSREIDKVIAGKSNIDRAVSKKATPSKRSPKGNNNKKTRKALSKKSNKNLKLTGKRKRSIQRKKNSGERREEKSFLEILSVPYLSR